MKLVKWALAFLRCIVFIFFLMLILILGSIFKIIFRKNNSQFRKRINQFSSKISSILLFLGRIRVNINFHYRPKLDQPYLIVANHMGMLDILALASFKPASFVTSYELKETPIVGWLTAAGGCLFVERRNRSNIYQEVANIQQTLKEDIPVVIFPEAKSTNGDYVLPFKKSLFTSAVDTNAQILPITINYHRIDNQPVTKHNRDYLCWYGDQNFLTALWHLFQNFSSQIELIIHEPLTIHSADDRTRIAELAHQMISKSFISLNR